jgi:hypothetical protein
MSDLVLTIEAAPQAESRSSASSYATNREVLVLSAILIIFQLIDGVLTAIGMKAFGIEAEGNPLLRMGMEIWGPATTLFVAKGLAILVVLMLARMAGTVPWIQSAMKGVIALYAAAAIIPWTIIHTKHFLL